MQVEHAGDGRGIVERQRRAVCEDAGEPAQVAHIGKRPAERARRAGDQDGPRFRFGGDRILRLGPREWRMDEPDVPLPPALSGDSGVRPPVCQCVGIAAEAAQKPDQGRRARRRSADVPYAGFVVAGIAGDKAAPVDVAQQSPRGQRANVDALVAQRRARLPTLQQPAQLFLAGAAEMALGDRDRQTVTVPRLLEQSAQPQRRRVENARRGVVVITLGGLGERILAVIEEALAGHIMVHADDVRGAGCVGDGTGAVGKTHGLDLGPHRVAGRDAAREQVPGQPAPFVVAGGDVRQFGRRIVKAEILGLHQPRGRVEAADRRHRPLRRVDLVQQRGPEGAGVAGVRVPEAVQRAETGGGQRFVDRGPVVDPRVPLRRCGCVIGEERHEVVGDQAGIARAAAVVDEAGDRAHAEVADLGEPRVAPGPVAVIRRVRGDAFPQQGVAQRLDAEVRKGGKIAGPVVMPRQPRLIPVRVADAIDGAFQPPPKFQSNSTHR